MAGRTLAIVSGASAGFGRSICRALAGHCAQAGIGVDFVLTGRNESGLSQTRDVVAEIGDTHVRLVPFDMGDISGLAKNLARLFVGPKEAKVSEYSKVLLFNNAGSLGDLEFIKGYDSVEAIAANVNVNVTSVIATTAEFLRRIDGDRQEAVIVNISSLTAIQAFPAHGLYCTGKAARDMFHRCVDSEKYGPKVKTLNYAPGPMDTAMQTQIHETCKHEDTRQFYLKMKQDNNLVDPNASAKVLVALLAKNEFESAAHLDYYDVAPQFSS